MIINYTHTHTHKHTYIHKHRHTHSHILTPNTIPFQTKKYIYKKHIYIYKYIKHDLKANEGDSN